MTKDWKVFFGAGDPHDGLAELPPPPPWRMPRKPGRLALPGDVDLSAEADRALPFLPTTEMVTAVNAALYLRRPLLLTGKPGTGKSTLIAKVAHELKLGPVLRWPIGSRSTVRGGIYEYDAVGRLQAGHPGEAPVESYLTLGPLGTALIANGWPRPLLIDEIDKSDLDFANDLLNVIEEGEYEIPELRRLGKAEVLVRDHLGRSTTVREGRIVCSQFPFVVMTSNGEREFPPAFLRRCIRLRINPPTVEQLIRIIEAHLARYRSATVPGAPPRSDRTSTSTIDAATLTSLINDFDLRRKGNQDVSTDQLLNAVFLTLAMPKREERTLDENELASLRESLFRPLSEPNA